MDIDATLFAVRGAPTAVSLRLGISQAAVSQWRRNGIPQSRRAEVEAALREHMRDVGWPAERAALVQAGHDVAENAE